MKRLMFALVAVAAMRSAGAEAIGDLFSLLMQHITVEEADQLPTVKKINLAAEIRSTIEGMTEQE